MKSIAIFVLFAVVAYASAGLLEYPEQVQPEDTDTAALEADGGQILHRQRRFTCDLFSFSSSAVTPNDAACAAKCIGKGKKGGHCENKLCKCRDDKWVG